MYNPLNEMDISKANNISQTNVVLCSKLPIKHWFLKDFPFFMLVACTQHRERGINAIKIEFNHGKVKSQINLPHGPSELLKKTRLVSKRVEHPIYWRRHMVHRKPIDHISALNSALAKIEEISKGT